MSRPHSDEHYARIADLARHGALTNGEIADAYGVPYSTVARWIRRARELELLPKTTRGVSASNGSCPYCGAWRSASAAYRHERGRP